MSGVGNRGRCREGARPRHQEIIVCEIKMLWTLDLTLLSHNNYARTEQALSRPPEARKGVFRRSDGHGAFGP